MRAVPYHPPAPCRPTRDAPARGRVQGQAHPLHPSARLHPYAHGRAHRSTLPCGLRRVNRTQSRPDCPYHAQGHIRWPQSRYRHYGMAHSPPPCSSTAHAPWCRPLPPSSNCAFPKPAQYRSVACRPFAAQAYRMCHSCAGYRSSRVPRIPQAIPTGKHRPVPAAHSRPASSRCAPHGKLLPGSRRPRYASGVRGRLAA